MRDSRLGRGEAEDLVMPCRQPVQSRGRTRNGNTWWLGRHGATPERDAHSAKSARATRGTKGVQMATENNLELVTSGSREW